MMVQNEGALPNSSRAKYEHKSAMIESMGILYVKILTRVPPR
jgi:hypothetical protein